MTPDNSWLTTKVGIGANNQRSYVARSFVQKHNLGAMITRHLTRLVTKVHFHGTSITSNEVLCTRLTHRGASHARDSIYSRRIEKRRCYFRERYS